LKAVNDGVQLIYNKFKSTLNQKGLAEMKSIGETFNPDIHEAITNVPAPSEDMKGKVVDELEKGGVLWGNSLVEEPLTQEDRHHVRSYPRSVVVASLGFHGCVDGRFASRSPADVGSSD
jgi:hypothetical protein